MKAKRILLPDAQPALLTISWTMLVIVITLLPVPVGCQLVLAVVFVTWEGRLVLPQRAAESTSSPYTVKLGLPVFAAKITVKVALVIVAAFGTVTVL
jgi:hypothetical protein